MGILEKQLFDAINEGNLKLAKELVINGADVNFVYKGDKENTPLIRASTKGSIEICRLLINNRAYINAKNSHGHTALTEAILHYKYDANLIKLLLENGADPNIYSSLFSETILQIASGEDTNPEILRMINNQDQLMKNNITTNLLPELRAAYLEDKEVEEYCKKVENRLGELSTDNLATTIENIRALLHPALKLNETLKIIDDQKIDTSYKEIIGSYINNYNNTQYLSREQALVKANSVLLAQANIALLTQAIGNNAPYEKIESLIDELAGATKEIKDGAVITKYTNPQQLNFTNDEKNTLLHIAAQHVTDLRIFDKILELQPNFINQQNEFGWSALHIAAMYQKPIIVDYLLQKGAKATLLDNNGKMYSKYLKESPASEPVQPRISQIIGHLLGDISDYNHSPFEMFVYRPFVDNEPVEFEVATGAESYRDTNNSTISVELVPSASNSTVPTVVATAIPVAVPTRTQQGSVGRSIFERLSPEQRLSAFSMGLRDDGRIDDIVDRVVLPRELRRMVNEDVSQIRNLEQHY